MAREYLAVDRSVPLKIPSMWSMAGMTVGRLGVDREKKRVVSLSTCVESMVVNVQSPKFKVESEHKP